MRARLDQWHTSKWVFVVYWGDLREPVTLTYSDEFNLHLVSFSWNQGKSRNLARAIVAKLRGWKDYHYCSQTKLQEGNVFTCLSVMAYTPLGRHPPGQTPPKADQMATEAGGTHPTGICSCYL